MKLSRKLGLLAISILLVISLMVGCSTKKSQSTEDRDVEYTSEQSPSAPQSEDSKNKGDFGGGIASPLEPEKVITTLYLAFETTEFEKSNEELNKLIEKYKAYVEYSNISYNQYYSNVSYRYGEFVIRVPKESIKSFKTELALIGNLKSESTNKQDVTKQYTDTESRLKVIEVKEARILALLQKAEKIEDIIALENQLSNTIYEKESLKASLLTLDDQVDFSTVNLNIQEVSKTTNAETVDTTFGTKVKNAINDSIYFFRNTLEGLAILMIYVLPFLIIIAILVYLAYKIIKKYRKDKPK